MKMMKGPRLGAVLFNHPPNSHSLNGEAGVDTDRTVVGSSDCIVPTYVRYNATSRWRSRPIMHLFALVTDQRWRAAMHPPARRL